MCIITRIIRMYITYYIIIIALFKFQTYIRIPMCTFIQYMTQISLCLRSERNISNSATSKKRHQLILVVIYE